MAIQTRRGPFGKFDPDKLLPGEWAAPLSGDPAAKDGRSVYMCFAPGDVKRMATYEDMVENIEEATEEIRENFTEEVEQAIQNAEDATQAANTAADGADDAAEAANTAAQQANTAAGNADDAAEAATAAKNAATSAASAANSAASSANTARDNANTATSAANSAASSATAAASSANTAKDAANEAAQAAQSIADEVQEKLDNGDFIGPRGPQGTAATVTIGTTTTGAPGSQAVVTNSGTSSAAVLNFTIPKGDTGAIENIDDVTVDFSQASARANIESGESFSTIFGKIKKWLADLVNGAASTLLGSNLTASRALISNSSGKVAVSTVTSTELGYLDGITGNLQTQLNGKQSTITGGASTITGNNLTANRALVSDGNGKVAASAVTSTELGYLDGVTSPVQTQLNGKQASVTGGASTITGSNLTANRALISNGSGKVAVSEVTSTELGYLDGAKSNIQDQIDELNSNLSQNQNGIFQLPNGLKIQWGQFTATYQNPNICLDNVTFEEPFKGAPSVMLTVQLTTGVETLSWKAGISNKTNSGFNCICADADSHFSDAYTPYVYWLAVGY